MLSTTSSVYSSRRPSHIDLKEALRELDMYYWKTNTSVSVDKTAAKTDPIDGAESEKPRGRSRRSSIKQAISKLNLTDMTMPQSPPLPSDVLTAPATAPMRSAVRSKSWGPMRRSSAKASRQPSPTPSFHGASEFIYDEEARAKLRTYLTDTDKFQEALEIGFPSTMPTPKVDESPIIPIPSQFVPRGRNLGLDVQRFMKNDAVSWLDNETSQSRHYDEPFLTDSPMSQSEREVDSLARELTIQNSASSGTESSPQDEFVTCYFDLSDIENAIDDSQDDRGTSSPVSPATPTTPEIVPIPLSTNTSPCTLSPKSQRFQYTDSLENCLNLTDTSTRQRAGTGGSSTEPISPLSDMIRTAPSISPFKYSQPTRPVVHLHSNSLPSVNEKPVKTVSPRKSENLQRPQMSHAPVSSRSVCTQYPHGLPSPVSPVSVAPPAQVPDWRLHASRSKPLPPCPRHELPPSPASPTSPISPSKVKKQHSRHAKKYTYDSPSAYVAPRSPPMIGPAPRQMTLRMTLTRPELRAADEDIYGGSHAEAMPAVYRKHTSRSKSTRTHRKKDKRRSLLTQPYDSTVAPTTEQWAGNIPILGSSDKGNKSSFEKKASVKHMKVPVRRKSGIEVVQANASTDTAHSAPTGRPIFHPDLPAHVLMRERDLPQREKSKREPNKLRKAKTEPVPNVSQSTSEDSAVSQDSNGAGISSSQLPVILPKHMDKPLPTLSPSASGESPMLLESGTPSILSPQSPISLPQAMPVAHYSPSQAPLAQMGPDGQWRLISPSQAPMGQKRTSLWKKLSISGMRGKPGAILP